MKLLHSCALFIFSFSAVAQWNTNAAINTPLGLAPKSQGNAHAVTDSKRGAIVAWDDNRNSATGSTDIYAQRIKNNGLLKWSSVGVAICTNAFTQKSVSIVDSDNGSAIITWEDNRVGSYDIYAQKIDSSGTVLWTTDGVAVCSKTTSQKNPKIISDNAGGGIIVWEDSVNFYWDVYAQRINSSGVVVWPAGGVGICTAPNVQINPKLDIDGLGGAIITWQDKRGNVDYDIYAQRINSSGTTLWSSNGALVCNAVSTQSNPRIEPDGASGAFIGWVDKRNGTDYNVYAQHMNSSGVTQWTANGLSVCAAANNQSALDMKYIGAAGLALAWKDDRLGTGSNAIYAQIVSSSGVNQLTANGILLSNALKSINPNTIADGTGGVIIAWQDSTSLGWDITSQKLNSSGVVQWISGGVGVCTSFEDQINVSHVTDGNGGAIFVWEDHRNGSDYDLYAHHLYYDGSAVVGIHELSGLNTVKSVCYPNPINGNSIIQLANNASGKSWEINVFDAFGHLVQTGKMKNGEEFSLNSMDYTAGVYFYFINLEGETSSKGSFISVK